jgi:alanine-glyoxylate transaminase/serine-glyoxylate transaminase/serine-pyruvate transaminase
MATPLIGHLDPDFLRIMGEVKELLRPLFDTENALTLAVPGTGTAAMEAALSNLVEAEDKVLSCVHGYFGERLALMAERYGAKVTRLQKPWGDAFTADEIGAAFADAEFKVVTLVHAETSTGSFQPEIGRIGSLCQATGALLVLDCVTSLGGSPVHVDEWAVDIAYSAGQKSLSAPPGLSPITVSSRARHAIESRVRPAPVFYFDLLQLEKYWSDQPAYHHTAPITTMYGLREALRLAHEEGLQPRYERHRRNAKTLWEGLGALGFELLVPEERRIPQLTTPKLPTGVDDAAIRRALLDRFNIEIAGGFGPLAGLIWRIGLMGYSSREEHVRLLLAALEQLLDRGEIA